MDIFRDKTAIVTGGASGIGKGLSEELAKNWTRVVVADLNGEEAGNVAASLNAVEWKILLRFIQRVSRSPYRAN